MTETINFQDILNYLQSLTINNLELFFNYLEKHQYNLNPDEMLILVETSPLKEYLKNPNKKINNKYYQNLVKVFNKIKDDKSIVNYNESLKDNASFIDLDHEILTFNEEQELLKKIKEGDKEAFDLLIKHNERLVFSIVNHYLNRAFLLTSEDLFIEGNIGLIKAIQRFDLNKKVKFSTYATWWIEQSITRAILELDRTIRNPIYLGSSINKVIWWKEKLMMENHKEATPEEIAHASGIALARVKNALNNCSRPYSLDYLIDEEKKTEMIDLLPTSENLEEDIILNEDCKQLMILVKEILSAEEYQVFIMRVGLEGYEPLKLEDVSLKLGVSKERIRQIETKALQKIRTNKLINNYKYSSKIDKNNPLEINKITKKKKSQLFDLKKVYPTLKKATFFNLLKILPLENQQLYCSYYGIDINKQIFYNTYEYPLNNTIILINNYLDLMVTLYEKSKYQEEQTKLEDIKSKMQTYFLPFKYPTFAYKYLKEAITRLNSDYQQIIFQEFGDNLLAMKQSKKDLKNIYIVINKELNGSYMVTKINKDNFYKLVNCYDNLRIKDSLELISLEAKEVIYQVHGFNFLEINDFPNQGKYERAIKELKNKISELETYKIIQDMPNISFIELNLITKYMLNEAEQSLLYTKYGCKLNSKNEFTLLTDGKEFLNKIKNKINIFMTHDLEKIITLNFNQDYELIKNNLDKEILLKLSNNKELEEYYKTLREVKNISQKYLNKNQQSFLKLIGVPDILTARELIAELTLSEANIIYKKHGYNFTEDNELKVTNIYDKTIATLKNTAKYRGIKRIFNEENLEQIKIIVKLCLSSEEQNLIYQVFGENLEQKNNIPQDPLILKKYKRLMVKIKNYYYFNLNNMVVPTYILKVPDKLSKLGLEYQELIEKMFTFNPIRIKMVTELNLDKEEMIKYYEIISYITKDSKVVKNSNYYSIKEVLQMDIDLKTIRKVINYLYEPYKNIILNVHGEELDGKKYNYKNVFDYTTAINYLKEMDFVNLERNIAICNTLNFYDLPKLKALIRIMPLDIQKDLYQKYGLDLTKNNQEVKPSQVSYLLKELKQNLQYFQEFKIKEEGLLNYYEKLYQYLVPKEVLKELLLKPDINIEKEIIMYLYKLYKQNKDDKIIKVLINIYFVIFKYIYPDYKEGTICQEIKESFLNLEIIDIIYTEQCLIVGSQISDLKVKYDNEKSIGRKN